MPKKNLKDTNQLCKINVPVSNKSTVEGCTKNYSEELDKCFVWSNNLFVLTNILIFRTNKILVKQIKFFYLDLLRLLIHLDRFLIPVNNSQTTGIKVQCSLSKMTRRFLYISREKHYSIVWQVVINLKISDFISELLLKYSKTNIFCSGCFLHACQVFDWPCEDMSDKVLQTFDVRWQSSLYDKLLIHRSVLMHSFLWRLWLMRLPEFYG